MLFENMDEAIEYAQENKLEIRGSEYISDGIEVEFKESRTIVHRDTSYNRGKEIAIIYTLIGSGSVMYIAERGTAFNDRYAKRFNRELAETKVKAMNAHTKKYVWKTKVVTM